MATHSTGDNKTRTFSLDHELFKATLSKWGKKKPYANFAKYLQHLIIEDLHESGHLPESFMELLKQPPPKPAIKLPRDEGNLNEKHVKKKGAQP